MTDAQKRKILLMKNKGIPYKEIASQLALPLTTVKSFCYRNSTAVREQSVCAQCGKPIEQSKFKPRRFCSDACRYLFWNEHKKDAQRSAIVRMTCPVCGKSFLDYPNRKRKYCCHDCYIVDRYYGGKKIDER